MAETQFQCLDRSKSISVAIQNSQAGHGSSQEFVSRSWNGARQVPTQMASHHRQRLPSRRNVSKRRTFRHSSTHHFSNLLFTIILIISSCCLFTTATPLAVASFPDRILDPRDSLPEDQRSALAQLAESGSILVDLSPPPPAVVAWHYDSEVLTGPDDPLLYKRQNGDPFSSDETTTSKSHSSTAAESTSAPTSTPSTTKVAPTTTSSGIIAAGTSNSNGPLPSPFDSSLGNNFTDPACPNFINGFLRSASFKACLPFSLLLQNSNSFFQAEKSVVRITQVLDATCAANFTVCAPYLTSLAQNLTLSSTCLTDYKAQNPTVIQAHEGLLAYQTLYSASCLKNPKTSSYCFADAITNASSPTDSYIYYLPLNASLPGGSQPTCSQCLQNTMAVFDAAAANRTLAISSTYADAAQQINVQCGPNFVNATIPGPLTGGAVSSLHLPHSSVGFAALAVVLAAWLF